VVKVVEVPRCQTVLGFEVLHHDDNESLVEGWRTHLSVDRTSWGRDWNANCVGVWGGCKEIDLMYSTGARARRYGFAITENYGTRSSGRIEYEKEKSFLESI
jgi:hypothetical protein